MPAVKKNKSKGSLKKTPSKTSYSEATRAIMPPAPGGPLEIVFTFDTTGSMSGCLMEVRKKVTDIINRLTSDIPALRIAVFAHGDYCDKATYVTKYVDFTNDVKKLTDFVNNVESTGGGDWEECYELVLHQARTLLSWSPGTQRSLVMIGDAIPHGVSYRDNKKKIDWKKETQLLKEDLGVKVYAVQVAENSSADFFWNGLADMTDGKRLMLNQFETIVDMMMAICYREQGAEFFDDYEKEVRAREGAALRAEVDRMFDTLRPDGASGSGEAGPPAPTMFGASATPVKHTPSDTFGTFAGTVMPEESSDEEDECYEEESEDESDSTWTPREETKYRKKTLSVKKTTAFKAKKPAVKVTAKRNVKRSVKGSAAGKTSGTPVARKLLLREMVPELAFKLSPLAWSPWQPMMHSAKDISPDTKWTKRAGHVGYQRKSLFQSETNLPAVYEVAVQPRHRAKCYPVYYRATTGFRKAPLDRCLLEEEQQKQADSALRKGCKILVRRARVPRRARCHGHVLTNVGELQQLMADTYDYPWCSKARAVEKAGVQISKAMK